MSPLSGRRDEEEEHLFPAKLSKHLNFPPLLQVAGNQFRNSLLEGPIAR